MIVTLEEMKNYLRVEYEDDDSLITTLINSAEKLCMDILRTEDEEVLSELTTAKPAVMFAVAYFYEHREEADYHALDITLRALFFGDRKAAF